MAILTAWNGKSRLIPDGVRLLLTRARADGRLTNLGEPQPTPWSLALLGFDDADYETLKEWYRLLDESHLCAFLGNSERRAYHMPSSRQPIHVEEEASFGLLFLALAAETARRNDSLHNLWPFVGALECPPRVKALLFNAVGHPTSDVKDALKAAIARFGLRHVRGVGKQEYYQTVLLQIGLPEGALPSLPSLLAGTRPLPDGVKALLDPDTGDFSFKQLWAALKRARAQDIAPATTLELQSSPWLRPAAVARAVELLRAGPRAAAETVDDSAPLGAAYVAEGEVRLSAIPQSFRPDFRWSDGQGVVDLAVDGKKVCRYTLRDGSLHPTAREPIELPSEPSVALELRYRDGTVAAEPRLLVLWNEEAPVVELRTRERGVSVLLVESEVMPEVLPATARVERFGDRWAVRTEGECSIRVDGQVVWSDGERTAEEIDLRMSLLSPFDGEARGELLVDAPAPWRVTAVSVAGATLSLERLDVHGTSFTATAVIRDLPTAPTARARVVLSGPGGSRVVQRSVPLSVGAWMRITGTWQRIDSREEVELGVITNARRLRFSLPGRSGQSVSLLAGDLTLGPIIHGSAPLPETPLGYGEPLMACSGPHGASAESGTRHALCAAVVNRGRGARFETRDGALAFVLAEPLRHLDPNAHKLVVWLADGGVETVELAPGGTGDQTITELRIPPAARAAALCVRATRQAVAWSADWSNDIRTDAATAHAALLVIRALGLPFLMEPHRSRIVELTERHPGLTARAWLARDPTYEAPTRALDGLLEQHDDKSEEIWLDAIRQLLEPHWHEAYAEEPRAREVFDELRRAQGKEMSGDYKRASRRLFALGPRSTAGLCASVWQKTDERRQALRESIAADLCEQSANPKRTGARRVDRLVTDAAVALGLSPARIDAVLALDANALPYRSAIHDETFRRLALRCLFAIASKPAALPAPPPTLEQK